LEPIFTNEGEMLDREMLVVQLAKAFTGHGTLDTSLPMPEERARAEDALRKVEMFLGTDVEQAREILTRVLEDVS
jgi:hypothetical protein